VTAVENASNAIVPSKPVPQTARNIGG
jgi:hypothetical protein